MSGCVSANRPSRFTNHLAAKSGDVLTVSAPASGLMPNALRAESDPIECVAHHLKIGAAGPRDGQPLPFAVEQPDAKFDLERLHLMAYCALRHRQLFCRLGEALVARRGLEGFEGVERWQSAGQFRTKVMRKTRARPRNHALRPAGSLEHFSATSTWMLWKDEKCWTIC